MTTYTIEPTRETLHGKFSREFPPCLTIDSGDTVIFRTLEAGWSIEPRRSAVIQDFPRKFEPRDPVRDNGHALCGPVAIRGAKPGMTLEVRIGEIRPAHWGWTAATGWPHRVNERFGLADGAGAMHLWALDAEAMIGRNQFGHEVVLNPFMGVMGMPTDEPGWLPTEPPRITGGNLDCKALTRGTALYLPIAVEGGLFSVGDGHAAQGDGEISVTAIECPMERVVLTFHLHDEMPLTTPRVWTPDAWMTLGLHEDLDEAGFRAIDAMLDLMAETYGIDRRNALALASVVVDLRVTQIVNGVQGVHAVLPHGAIR